MAEEELTTEEEQPKKKSGMLKWIIIVVLLAVLGGGGFFAYTKFFAPAPEEQPQEQAEGQGEGEGTEAPNAEIEGQLVTLPPFLVNLADPLGRRYLKLGIDVEVKDEETVVQMGTSEVKIKDAILLLLSSKSYQDLSTLESKIELKKEIVQRIDLVIGKGKVLNIYFTEMVIQ